MNNLTNQINMKISLQAVQSNFEDQLLYMSFLVDYSTTSQVEQTNENKSRCLRKVMLLSHVDIHEKIYLTDS